MKKHVVSKWIGSLGVAAVLTAAPAFAASVNVRPVTLGSPSLQNVLDSITASGPGIDAVADQSGRALFHSEASGGSVATFIIELAGFASANTFGIYENGDTANRAEIFGGSDTAGDQAFVSFMANGDIKVNNIVVASNFGRTFGFYITTPQQNTFFTEDDENGGNAQALVFVGDDETMIEIPGFQQGLFTDSHVIVAFEDLALPGGDKSYDDLVVMIESVHAAPVPAAALAGIPMLGLMGLRQLAKRRRA